MLRTFNVTVNGKTYEVKVEEVQAAAPKIVSYQHTQSPSNAPISQPTPPIQQQPTVLQQPISQQPISQQPQPQQSIVKPQWQTNLQNGNYSNTDDGNVSESAPVATFSPSQFNARVPQNNNWSMGFGANTNTVSQPQQTSNSDNNNDTYIGYNAVNDLTPKNATMSSNGGQTLSQNIGQTIGQSSEQPTAVIETEQETQSQTNGLQNPFTQLKKASSSIFNHSTTNNKNASSSSAPNKVFEFSHKDLPNTGNNSVLAPMPGTISRINVQEGSSVRCGDVLCVINALGVDSEIMSPVDSKVVGLFVTPGAVVSTNDILITLI